MTCIEQHKITIFYDGACPSCIRDRKWYEWLSGKRSKDVSWFDITDKGNELCQKNIDPKLALSELHIQTEDGQIIREIDAYIVLMQRIMWLQPIAFVLKLPVVKPLLAMLYHYVVNKRLKRTGRI
ncbi:thiol-disulfide oxidoreductase [Methylophaga sp. 42_25_T18]|nr:thiol-disulfide oxidoreductase [Methylophaga sp. 42_25_T18]